MQLMKKEKLPLNLISFSLFLRFGQINTMILPNKVKHLATSIDLTLFDKLFLICSIKIEFTGFFS
jgi:hypothetical protein